VIALGPLAGTYIGTLQSLSFERRPQLWAVSELPIAKNPMPQALVAQLARASILCVAEEHVQRGGLGSELAFTLLDGDLTAGRFVHLCAKAHHYDRYGSQGYLRRISGLDAQSLLSAIGQA
jgi:transketolase